MPSVKSSLHFWSPSRLLMSNESLDRPFFSFRSCQLFWGRSSFQILHTWAAANLKPHHCPLSVFPLLAYVWNTCLLSVLLAGEQGKEWCMWCAATLPVPGHWLFCWWVVCSSDCRLFAFGIKNMFLHLFWQWKQCPGNSVPYYPAVLLRFCSALLPVLTRTHFLQANLNISYEYLLCKQTKLHFSWVNPISQNLF